MTDLFDLLDAAAGRQPAGPVPHRLLDADLARGRRALRRRRAVAATGLAAAAVVAAVTVVAGTGGRDLVVDPARTGTPTITRAVTSAVTSPGPAVLAPVRVPDAATQNGVVPVLGPRGWAVAVDSFTTVFAPPGRTPSLEDYAGELVVGVDTESLEPGLRTRSVRVGGVRGVVWHRDGETVLMVPPTGSPRVVVRAPDSLGWDTATLVRFAAGVTLTGVNRGTVG